MLSTQKVDVIETDAARRGRAEFETNDLDLGHVHVRTLCRKKEWSEP